MSDPKSFDTIEGVETSQEHPLTTKLGQVGRLFIIVQTDFAETNTRGKHLKNRQVFRSLISVLISMSAPRSFETMEGVETSQGLEL